MEASEFSIKTLGTLRYSRIKSLSILRKQINSYGHDYSMAQTKWLLDSILNNVLEEYFTTTTKLALDEIPPTGADKLSDDEIRHNLKDAELWIEQARLSYFQHKDKAHYKKSLKFASKFINACR